MAGPYERTMRVDPPKPEPADFADPHLDLRTLTVEETNQNWARVQEIIKEQADARKESDAIYRAESAERMRLREEKSASRRSSARQ